MAKIELKTDLTLGTNVKLHIADKVGTDIVVTDNTGGTCTITSTTTDFSTSPETAGIINRAIVIGDVLTLGNTTEAANEGYQCTVTAVSANSITGDDVSGAVTTEAAGSNINVVATKKTYQFLEAGALSFVDGVQGLIFHSWGVDLWDTDDLDKYPYMFTSIEPRAKSMANKDGWEPHDTNTLHAIRDTALEIRATATSAYTRAYALLRSPGSLHAATDQLKFWPGGDAWDTAPQLAVMTGYINQLVLIDEVGGTDNTGAWFTRCAEQGKTIIMEEHDLQYAEIYPIATSNAVDPKITHDDTTVGGAGYSSILFYLEDDLIYDGDVDGVTKYFTGYIDANEQAHEEAHEKTNWLLRQTTDINSHATGPDRRGDKQWPKTSFSGEVFTVQCYLLNMPAAQRNNLRVVDTSGDIWSWPTIVALTINSPDLLVGGEFSIFHANTYGSSSVVYLQDESDIDQHDIGITSSVGITIAYSGYNVGGHTPGTPIDCVLAFNRPGYVEPDTITFTVSDTALAVTLVPKADPSYVA